MPEHPFPPVFDERSRILILGSFPSVKSRETAFFYGHPQNRFWPLLARLLGERKPESVEEKTRLLLSRRIALWDVVASCEIRGSSDLSIKNAEANDLSRIFAEAQIRAIFCNGKTSFALYRKLLLPKTRREAICLPSTSPANAAWNEDRLFDSWKIILQEI